MPKIHLFKRAAKVKKPAADIVLSDRFDRVRIHPCVIAGHPHFVFPRGMREASPNLYQKLVRYAAARNHQLKEDQRSRDQGYPKYKDRRKWAPVMLFTASMLFEGRAAAQVAQHQHTAESAPEHQIVLRIVPKPGMAMRRGVPDSEPQDDVSMQLKSDLAEQLYAILNAHYTPRSSDPDYVRNDLKQVANYYSNFPEVVDLLRPLKDRNWEMVYDPENWDTVGIGSLMEVYKAVIHFNTRSAAQLLLNRKCRDNPVCIASPADALLHELLHTHSMLLESEKFIEQGGMNNVMYPYEHEYAIIDAERKLYASMSTIDDARRPQRTDHTGRPVYAHCPVCIK